MPAYLVRQMHEDDLSEVVTLVSEAGDYPWSFKQVRDSLLAKNDKCFVLCETGSDTGNETVLAYAVMQTVLDESHLLNIAVQRSRQGSGFGRSLLGTLIETAVMLDSHTLLLEVRSSNQSAIGLYEKLGFVKSGVRKAYYPAAEGREDAWLYSLSLL